MGQQADDTGLAGRRGSIRPVQLSEPTTRLGVATGSASVVLGFLVVAWPAATLVVVAVLFGLQLVFMGARRLAVAVLSGAVEGWVRALVGMTGVLVLVLGLVCLRNPFTSVGVIAVLVSLGWFIDGVSDIVAALTRPEGVAWMYVVGGVLSLVAAGVILYWPALTISTLLQVGGWLLVFLGVTQLATSLGARRAAVRS